MLERDGSSERWRGSERQDQNTLQADEKPVVTGIWGYCLLPGPTVVTGEKPFPARRGASIVDDADGGRLERNVEADKLVIVISVMIDRLRPDSDSFGLLILTARSLTRARRLKNSIFFKISLTWPFGIAILMIVEMIEVDDSGEEGRSRRALGTEPRDSA